MKNDRLQKLADQTNKQILIKSLVTAVIFVVIFVVLDALFFGMQDDPRYYFWMAVIFSSIFALSDVLKRKMAQKQLEGAKK